MMTNFYTVVFAAFGLVVGSEHLIAVPRPELDQSCEAMLIVTPAVFRAEVDRYAQAASGRERHGGAFHVDVAELETILDAATVGDDAEKLKRFIAKRAQRLSMRETGCGCEFRYVLLFGDADILPVRYMCLDRNTDAAFNYAFYPSDLYYADLTKPDGSFEDWNGNKDDFHAGYYGEVRGEHNKSDPINFDHINYKPTIAVGRWPVTTAEQVQAIADKTIAYEKWIRSLRVANASDPSKATKPAAAMIAVDGWVENKSPMDAMAAKLGDAWTIEKRYDHTKGLKPPTAAEVVSLLNAGTRIIFHTGHGEPNSWAGSFGVAQLSQLHNADHPAIMLSAGCSTACFATLPPYQAYTDINGVEHKGTDAGEVFAEPPPPPSCYAKGAHNTTGLGERLIRDNTNGAVAYFGCNTGSQPCGITLLEGFADALGASPDKPLTLGDCWVHAISYYYDHQHLADLKPSNDWYPPSIFFQGMKFMLFGDPSIPMR